MATGNTAALQADADRIARLEAALRMVVHNADHSPMGRVLGGIAKAALQVEMGLSACTGETAPVERHQAINGSI